MISTERIQTFVDSVVREFQPERIILFGSHARGDAGPDSDVDVLVIMPQNGKTRHQQTVEIHAKCHPGFPVDVLVRTGQEFAERLAMRDWFMQDIAKEGAVLYAA